MGMGWFGWTEVHPFTISSVSRGQEGIVLICKKTGNWTETLFEVASLDGYVDGEIGRKVKVVVEGPYGQCINQILMVPENNDRLTFLYRWTGSQGFF